MLRWLVRDPDSRNRVRRSRSHGTTRLHPECSALEDRRLLSSTVNPHHARADQASVENRASSLRQARRYLHAVIADIHVIASHSHATKQQLIAITRDAPKGTITIPSRGTGARGSAIQSFSLDASLLRIDSAYAIITGFEQESAWFNSATVEDIRQRLNDYEVSPDASTQFLTNVRSFAVSINITIAEVRQLLNDLGAYLNADKNLGATPPPSLGPSAPIDYITSHVAIFVHDRHG